MPTPPVTTPEVDDLGYTTPEEVKPIDLEAETPEEVKPDEEKPAPTDELPVEKKATGYGEEEEPEEKPAEKTAEELAKEKEDEENKTDEEKAADKSAKEVKENIKKHIELLPDSVSKDAVTKFAEENGLNDKQVEAYVKLAQADHDSLVGEKATAVKEQRKAWKDELEADADFGGENFVKNVDRVEKVLDKYMPDTKKVLTERGTMLPPYIMRDFLKLDKILNPTTKLTTGEPPAVKKEEVSLLDELYS